MTKSHVLAFPSIQFVKGPFRGILLCSVDSGRGSANLVKGNNLQEVEIVVAQISDITES